MCCMWLETLFALWCWGCDQLRALPALACVWLPEG